MSKLKIGNIYSYDRDGYVGSWIVIGVDSVREEYNVQWIYKNWEVYKDTVRFDSNAERYAILDKPAILKHILKENK